MVQFNSPTSILFFAALLASANLSVVCAKPRFTVRDLVDDHLYSRDVDHYDSFITRDEIEELFGRHLDMDLSSIHSRDLADIYARHPDHFVNFFESVGSFVKRCVRGYWRHMVRK
ncbi:hypothetical protein DFP72DRAFT_887468 [Ephemerocybe angulata]|uniref:Uncharacterized protein n=1 Tax=Ephemerocybe angulata TaxID=980116 RepID=A0A8H6I431_9AGAR|nr:hypothetical protein DFP72DRAFT_887468 [Tulosesus angulatus]